MGTIFVDTDIDHESRPVDYNPCVSRKLCVAACPVGAITPDGGFDASACMTHNYREFLHGFTDWVEHVADSRNARGKAKGIEAVYHLIFTGKEPAEATVTIRRQMLQVQRGLMGNADCTITADSRAWLGFLRKERSIFGALLTGRIRVRGGLGQLRAFGRCFPG